LGKRPSPVDVHVGQRLKQRRNEVGKTQEYLAESVGLTFQQIQKYEKGANRISASRLQQFADTLNVDVPWFFEGAPGSRGAGLSADHSTKELKEFTSLPDAQRLMKAFVQIEDKELRRHIAQLVERLGEIG
jgi:transcriptional regulator with XRE-family HTH domain